MPEYTGIYSVYRNVPVKENPYSGKCYIFKFYVLRLKTLLTPEFKKL